MADFLLTPVYDVLLRGSRQVPYGLYHLQLAYAEQLCRLHYSPNSIKLVKRRLKELRDNGYIQAFVKPTQDHGTPFYYTMGPNGMAYLGELEYDISKSWRPSKEERKNLVGLDHTLELNDVLISAMLLHTADPSFVLDQFKHERVLKRTHVTVQYQGTKVTVIPDAFLKFRTPAGTSNLLIEHDRGTEFEKFKEKIRRYIALLREERTPIAFTTFLGQHRVDQMRAWTLEELTVAHQPKSIGVYFRFTSLEPPLAPATVWLSARWYTPYDEPPQAMLAA